MEIRNKDSPAGRNAAEDTQSEINKEEEINVCD